MELPDRFKTQGQANAYVETGKDKSERTRRLKEAPEAFKPGIISHVNTVMALRLIKRTPINKERK
jgi:hypothetical protein